MCQIRKNKDTLNESFDQFIQVVLSSYRLDLFEFGLISLHWMFFFFFASLFLRFGLFISFANFKYFNWDDKK